MAQRTETGHLDPLFPKTRVYFLILEEGFALIISESGRTRGLCSDLCFLSEHPGSTRAGAPEASGALNAHATYTASYDKMLCF